MAPNVNTVKFGNLTQIDKTKKASESKSQIVKPTFTYATNGNTDTFVVSSKPKEIQTISQMPDNVAALLAGFANQNKALMPTNPSFLAATGNTLRTIIGGDKKPEKSSFVIGDEATQVA
jgi:hypothetical protein